MESKIKIIKDTTPTNEIFARIIRANTKSIDPETRIELDFQNGNRSVKMTSGDKDVAKEVTNELFNQSNSKKD